MATTFIEYPMTWIILFGIVVVFVIYKFYGKSKNEWHEFKPQKSRDTYYKEFKNKVNTQGMKIKGGKLVIGLNKVAEICKWFWIQGQFVIYYYEENNKKFVIDEETKPKAFNLVLLQCQSKSFIKKIFGIGKWYIFIDKASILRFDDVNNTFILRDGTDLIPYADIWINSTDALEYLENVSIKRQNIELMTQLENYPHKIVHLEMNQAKKERLFWQDMETNKARYDQIKKAEDTSVM